MKKRRKRDKWVILEVLTDAGELVYWILRGIVKIISKIAD